MRLQKSIMPIRAIALIFILCLLFIGEAFAESGKYVIIYHDDLSSVSMDSLISLQQNRGFDVSSYGIGDGTDLDSIKSIIISEYEDGLLRYVLLVGAARRDYDTSACLDCYADYSEGNLIPTYFEYDGNGSTPDGYLAAFDYWYSIVDSTDGGYPYKISWPHIIVGRIPALDSIDVQIYVDKLTYYLNDNSPADWKSNSMVISGDKFIDVFGSGHPVPELINSETVQIGDILETNFNNRILKYSDYSSTAEREDAIAANLDSGKVLVSVLSTGSSIWNVANMLYRRSDLFDANTDLDSTDRYSVWLAASCNLGQSDMFSETNDRPFPENLLFAPHQGAIAYIGPSGYSIEDENYKFLKNFATAINKYPGLPLGQYYNAAQHKDTVLSNWNYSTLRMYTYYGDPSIKLNSNEFTGDYQTFFDFEYGKPLPLEDSAYQDCNQIVDSICGIRASGGWGSIDRYFRIIGNDQYDALDSAYKSWLIYDELGIPIDQSTRFMTYLISSRDHPENIGMYGVNGILRSGPALSDEFQSEFVTDQYGTKIDAANRSNELHKNQFYAIDLTMLQGDTLDKIILEYAADDPASDGVFDFIIRYVSFDSVWGGPPIVDEIDAPSQLIKNYTTPISVDAIENDSYFGDTLAYDWSASAGYFTGSGSSLHYHAPGSAQTVTVYLSVTDLGGHQVDKQTTIDITDGGGGGGCPFLYSFDGETYQFENVILTASERFDREDLITTDFYPLSKAAISTDGNIKLRIAEEENERSHIYEVGLLCYDISSLKENEQLAMAGDGRLVAAYDPIKPIFAFKNSVYNVLGQVLEEDNNIFYSNSPGSLAVGFNLNDFVVSTSGKALEQEEGGGIIDPPEKPIDKVRAAYKGSSRKNYVTVDMFRGEERWEEIEAIYPRIESTIPRIVNFTPLIANDNSNWFCVNLTWNRSFQIDNFAFYRFRSLPLVSNFQISSAYHSIEQNIYNELTDPSSSIQLSPDNAIDMEFNIPKAYDYSKCIFVLRITGYYEEMKYNSPEESGNLPLILDQNHPNPFNPNTIINFDIRIKANVKIDIYNILGQKLREFEEGELPPGKYSIEWDGTDARGNKLSTGIYFYRIKAGEYEQSKKMMLIK